jgi:peptidylprolyl isomerase
MEKVENGCYVQVHYTGTLENGDVFDSTTGGTPLEIKMGAGQLIEGFESALLDMSVSEKKSITLAPDKAYGMRDETLQRSFERTKLPAGMNPSIGDTLALKTAQGQTVPVVVQEIDQEKIVVDLNHPLAGKVLKFDLEIAGISDQPTQNGCGCGCDTTASTSPNGDPCGGCSTPGACG